MIKNWKQLGAAVAAAAMVTTVGATIPANAAQAKVRYAKLYAMKTPAGGFFYTTSKKEATAATKNNKFKLVHVNLGKLRSKGKGTLPLYRLRLKTGGNYIVCSSKKEVKRLRKSGKFVYEGFLGYGYKKHHSNTVHLWRLTNGHTWQIAKTNRANYLKHHGWKLDGPLAWARK